ncbi:unnamed protein product [Zymoseptoria tritici ST99CH_3D7]|uniref:Uncharacterized protein n=1 Tax=Zymoseptoria tritici (strain ST99CH_3D7) TaxID=1276538 RepID=A0A1X7S9P7_ZYMT9|nr:unnamed protein product [Zymoseptoria tritici ST99CH_3D7]
MFKLRYGNLTPDQRRNPELTLPPKHRAINPQPPLPQTSAVYLADPQTTGTPQSTHPQTTPAQAETSTVPLAQPPEISTPARKAAAMRVLPAVTPEPPAHAKFAGIRLPNLQPILSPPMLAQYSLRTTPLDNSAGCQNGDAMERQNDPRMPHFQVKQSLPHRNLYCIGFANDHFGGI